MLETIFAAGRGVHARLARFNCRTAHLVVARLERAMTVEGVAASARPPSRGVICPSFAPTACPPRKQEGAGKAGCALHPRSRVQVCAKNAHTSIQVQRRQSGFPCASGFTAYFVLSPVTGLFATVAWRISPRNLAPAPGRQDHTTSPSASATLVSRGFRVHRISPRVRDDRDPPLSSGETRGVKPLSRPTTKAEFHPSG
jgi:hypothetical protein